MEKILKLDEKTARKLYPEASLEFKKLIEENFDRSVWMTDITERIKTLKDACEDQEVDYGQFLHDLCGLPTNEQGFRKLKIIARALRQDFLPDYSDKNQQKWFAYHRYENGGFVFNDAIYDFNDIYNGVPALALPNQKLAIYMGKQFLNEYNEYNTL